MSKVTEYDKTEFYKKELEEKINELSSLCTLNGIPLFISVCIANNEEQSVYKHKLIAADIQGITLKDDMFTRFLNVTLGFDTVYKAPDTETALSNGKQKSYM